MNERKGGGRGELVMRNNESVTENEGVQSQRAPTVN